MRRELFTWGAAKEDDVKASTTPNVHYRWTTEPSRACERGLGTVPRCTAVQQRRPLIEQRQSGFSTIEGHGKSVLKGKAD